MPPYAQTDLLHGNHSMKTTALLTSLALALALAACDSPSSDSGSAAGGDTSGAGQMTDDTKAPAAQADVGGNGEAGADAGTTEPGEDVTDPGGGAGGHPDVVTPPPDVPVEQPVVKMPIESENLWNANAVCPPAGPFGEASEDIVRDLLMKDCATGEPLDLHDLCGAQSYWLYMTAGWCPYCGELSASLKDEVDPALVESGARIVVVVFQDAQGKPASAQYCNSYADKYGIPRDRVIMAYDPVYSAVSLNTTGGTPFHVLLDRDLRIRLMYSGGDDAGTPLVYLKSIIKDQNKKDAKAAAANQ